jgi:hypothetical protein
MWPYNTSGGLLGETLVASPFFAKAFADRSLREADELWSEDYDDDDDQKSSSHWNVVYNDTTTNTTTTTTTTTNLVVEACNIMQGPYAASKVLLTRFHHPHDTSFTTVHYHDAYIPVDPVPASIILIIIIIIIRRRRRRMVIPPKIHNMVKIITTIQQQHPHQFRRGGPSTRSCCAYYDGPIVTRG